MGRCSQNENDDQNFTIATEKDSIPFSKQNRDGELVTACFSNLSFKKNLFLFSNSIAMGRELSKRKFIIIILVHHIQRKAEKHGK